MPCRRRVNLEHVVNVCGTGLTPTERTEKIKEINKESLAAVEWGRMQVKQRMMFAMTIRAGLKVGNRHAKFFPDIKNSLREASSNPNIARIYKTCYGDDEGEEAKRWSFNLEAKHMREMRLDHRICPSNLRDKCGIEMCMTKAKVDMINKVWCEKAGTSVTLSLKGETSLPAEMAEERKRDKMMIKRNEGKAHRRRIGEFCAKKKARTMTCWCCEMCPDCCLTTR
jgi:hypothetical protein